MKGTIHIVTLDDGRVVELAVIQLSEDTHVIVAQDGTMLGVMNRDQGEAINDFLDQYEKEIKFEIVE